MSKFGQNAKASASKIDHSPVTVPPGSFDHDELEKGLARAAEDPDKRDAHLEKALIGGNQTPIPDTTVAPAAGEPGAEVFLEGGVHKIVDRSTGAPFVRDATDKEIAAANDQPAEPEAPAAPETEAAAAD